MLERFVVPRLPVAQNAEQVLGRPIVGRVLNCRAVMLLRFRKLPGHRIGPAQPFVSVDRFRIQLEGTPERRQRALLLRRLP
jgi:hypothetical protein